MAKPQMKRGPKGKGKDNGRKFKKKISILNSESIDYVDWKDVNLLRRFVSDRAKVRARRVTGNDVQQQREVAKAIKIAREMALIPYANRVTTQRGGRRGDRDGDDRRERRDRPERDDSAPTPPAAPEASSEFTGLDARHRDGRNGEHRRRAVSAVKVILRNDVSGLGKRGDIVEVSKGYVRNYLEPRGLAMAATEGAQQQAEAMRRSRDIKDARDRGSAEQIATVLVPKTITIRVRASEAGRLFGSVSETEIVDAVRAATGIELDRKDLLLDEHIKDLGSHMVTARLHSDVQFPITLDVISE